MPLQNMLGFKGINPAMRNIALNYNTRSMQTKKGKKKSIKMMKDAMNELVRKQDGKGLSSLMMMVKPSMSKDSQSLLQQLDTINKKK